MSHTLYNKSYLCARIFVISVIIVPLFNSSTIFAQQSGTQRETESFVNQQLAVQRELREKIDEDIISSDEFSFDYGGWYSFYLFSFDDGINSSRVLRRHDLRLWTNLSFEQGVHNFYLRSRLSFLDFNAGDSFDGNEDDIDGMNLERGVYTFDLGKYRQITTGKNDFNMQIKAGRDLVVWGEGITLAENLDHVMLRHTFDDFQLEALAGQTVRSTRDIDPIRNAQRNRRNFYGLKVNYLGFEKHRPYAYVLIQRDQNNEDPVQLRQNFDYDSEYFSLGSTGELVQHVNYSTELIYQSGKSFGNGATRQTDNIDAYAALARVEYLIPSKHEGRLIAEYLFASGDRDRSITPLSSVGGNATGTPDENFSGFGFRDTGLSFTPQISNIHMIKLGAAVKPFPDQPRFKEFEIGTNLFYYHKHRRVAAVSDPTADLNDGYLGWEMDYFVNWQITSDLFWTVRTGVFFPGPAFSDQSNRVFAFTGMTWSF